MSDLGPWVDIFDPKPDAQIRLLTIPFAGAGSIVFRPWKDLVPHEIELCAVEFPGRWRRADQPLKRRISDLAEGLYASVNAGLEDKPWALFGHSLGALVGFEFLRLVRKRQSHLPVHFFASGRRAPHLETEADARDLYKLDDSALVEAIDQRYGGMDPRIKANQDLLDLLIPILRADFEAFGTYCHQTDDPLPVPITTFGGSEDPVLPEGSLDAWQRHTSKDFRVLWHPGDHFFFQKQPQPLIKQIVGALATDAG